MNKPYIKEAIINQINTHGITFTTIEDKKCFIGDIQILIEDILARNREETIQEYSLEAQKQARHWLGDSSPAIQIAVLESLYKAKDELLKGNTKP